ncbi:GumC family protein [Candidatus Nitronereus thalassa]|uniref:non-specific protein-tyrosine kinase n=1 Tax=Candidatus Nitronereus thalassa TaxID=3020898 RepID=A0ABU3K6J0_9BACT|nr:GNVR domain-containing protein [Candidatus Nitronereus thalassa]MDT7041991.1 GNVR domain-containing protein [Candidatus Nitronereus thalassa]
MERKSLEYMGRGASPSLQGKVKDYVEIAIRRKWLILSIVMISVGVAGTLAWFKKDVYRSSTVILVEQQTIPEQYVTSVLDDVASRVSTITQQVLSRTSLVKVIEEFGLFQDVIQEEGYEMAILSMRKNIQVETKGRNRIEAFTISFAHEDPTTAMKVTSRLASQYIEENLKLREQFVEGASDFLETELRAARQELETKERALSQFKNRYMGELPSQLESNISTLDRKENERNSIQESLNASTNRLLLVEQAIREYEASGAISTDSKIKLNQFGYNQQDSSARTPVDSQVALLKKLEQDLVKLQAEYKSAYPDVISLKQQIALLKDEIAGRPVVEQEEPPTQEPIKVFDPYLKGLLKDRNELRLQVESQKSRLATLAESMEKLQGQVDRTAAREQEMLALERDYANMQENYQNILEKRLNARISENLEKRQKGERFRILDPANLPKTPDGPLRAVIVLAGLLLGCVLGYGVAFVIEQWNPTFRRSEDAEISLGFPILATIPSFQSAYGKSSDGLLLGGGTFGSGDEASANGNRELVANVSDGGKWRGGLTPNPSLVSRWRPSSIVAEQYRVAATRLVLMNTEQANTVVLATSAMKGEGKTSSVVNLGYTLARDLEKQVLLIGCDFKAPRLHEAVGMPAAPGLADYFHGDVGLENCIHRMDDVPMWVLPAGAVEDHAVSLSRLPQLAALIGNLRSRFDYILVDAPPILPLADMNVLAGLADLLILVVRAGVTPQEIVVKAMDMLRPTVQARILLTDASSHGMPYFMSQETYGAPYTAVTRESV